MPVRVTLAEGTWLTDDLTLGESIEIERETGESWARMNPLRSAVQARAILVRFLQRSMTPEEAAARVDAMRVADVLDALEVVPEDDRPKQHVDGVPQVDPKGGGAGQATT